MTNTERGEAAVMMARMIWPEGLWSVCNARGDRAVNGQIGVDAPCEFDPSWLLDDCHTAAMWLRDNHYKAYEDYHYASRMLHINNCADTWAYEDAPSEVRAAALAEQFKAIIGGEGE